MTSFSYEGVGGLIGEVRSSGVSTTITRDLVGRVTSLVYTGKGVTGNPLPSGVVNPSSAAPGNSFGHCKANGNGHPNQQPAGCTTGTLTFTYAYDGRGLVTQRDVTTGSTVADAVTTRTMFAHDALGRLTRSVTGTVVTLYGWDAVSNLVTEMATDDASTSQVGDGYAVTRSVNAGNQLISLVKDPMLLPASQTTTTAFTYDGRGNRTGEVTTTQTGNATHTVASASYGYDSRDQLTSTTGPDGSALWVRDGAGRALTVTEGGVASNRLFDGFMVVADGATQLTVAPDGSALSESTTTTTIKGKVSTTSVASVDTLTDALGSTVATASNGVISADLTLYGDFGDLLTTPKTATSPTATVTGFTGKVETAGLVEFVARTYDPATRQWVQDDRYGGTVLRASSMNRYAYVEGAPETYVDAWGLYRARAAIQAQALAARNAAFQSALAELNQVVGSQSRLQGWTVAQMMASYNQFHASDDPVVRAAMDQIARQAFYGVWDLHYQQKVQVALQEQAIRAQKAHDQWVVEEKARVLAREQARIDAYNKSQDKGYLGGFVDSLSIAGHALVNYGGGAVNGLTDLVNFGVDVIQTTYNAVSPLCWTDIACASIGDIGDVPIWGDYDTYRWSSYLGTAGFYEATALVGAGTSAAPAESRIFYSGGEAAKEAAEAAAIASGGTTLELTIAGRVLTALSSRLPWAVMKPLWTMASADYAAGARGIVQVFLSLPLRERATWTLTELPRLIKNGVQIIENLVP